MAQAKRDQNRIPTLIGVTDADGVTPKLVYVADATNRLKVDAVVTAGLSSQTGVIDNEAVDAADAGALILGTDGSNYQVLAVDSSGNLQVDIVSGGGGGTEYTEDVATPATIVGTATMMERDDALSALTPAQGDWASLRCDANGALWVIPSGTVTVDGSGVTQPVSLASVPSHAVTNAGTFAVQISDPSFAVGDGNALGEGVLIQGDDGTDRKNINVDATTGDVQVDVTNTVTVDLGGNNDVTVTSGTVTANLGATDNAVLDDIAANTGGYSVSYQAAAGANLVVKNSAGVLRAILVGDAVASSIIEVSDHASDGDGNVKIYLAGNTLGPALYPCNMSAATGITADITNQTHTTFFFE